MTAIYIIIIDIIIIITKKYRKLSMLGRTPWVSSVIKIMA